MREFFSGFEKEKLGDKNQHRRFQIFVGKIQNTTVKILKYQWKPQFTDEFLNISVKPHPPAVFNRKREGGFGPSFSELTFEKLLLTANTRMVSYACVLSSIAAYNFSFVNNWWDAVPVPSTHPRPSILSTHETRNLSPDPPGPSAHPRPTYNPPQLSRSVSSLYGCFAGFEF